MRSYLMRRERKGLSATDACGSRVGDNRRTSAALTSFLFRRLQPRRSQPIVDMGCCLGLAGLPQKRLSL